MLDLQMTPCILDEQRAFLAQWSTFIVPGGTTWSRVLSRENLGCNQAAISWFILAHVIAGLFIAPLPPPQATLPEGGPGGGQKT